MADFGARFVAEIRRLTNSTWGLAHAELARVQGMDGTEFLATFGARVIPFGADWLGSRNMASSAPVGSGGLDSAFMAFWKAGAVVSSILWGAGPAAAVFWLLERPSVKDWFAIDVAGSKGRPTMGPRYG